MQDSAPPPKKIPANQIEEHNKKTFTMTKFGFTAENQGGFNIRKPIYIKQSHQWTQGEKSQFHLNRCRKSIDKNPTSALEKLGIQKYILNKRYI